MQLGVPLHKLREWQHIMANPRGVDIEDKACTERTSPPRNRSPLRLASCGVTPWLPAMEAYAAKQDDLQLPAAGSLCPYPRSNSPGRRAQQVYGPLQELRRQRHIEDTEHAEQPAAPASQQQQSSPTSSSPPGQQVDMGHGSSQARARTSAGASSLKRCPSPPPTHVGWARCVSPPHCPALAEAVRRSDKQLALRRLVSSASAAARPYSRLVAVPPEGEDEEVSGSSRGGDGCVLSFGSCYRPVTGGAGVCSSAVPGGRDLMAQEADTEAPVGTGAAAGPAAGSGGFGEEGAMRSSEACQTQEQHAQEQQEQPEDGGGTHAAEAAASRRHVGWAEDLQATPCVQPPLAVNIGRDSATCHSSHASGGGGGAGVGGSGASTALTSSSSNSSCEAGARGDVAAAAAVEPEAAAPSDVPPAAALDPARILADLAAAAGMLPSAQVMLLDTCGRPHTSPATCSSGPLWDTPSCAPAAAGYAMAGLHADVHGSLSPSPGSGSRSARYTSSNREVPILGAACGGWTTCTLLEPRPIESVQILPLPSYTSSSRPAHNAGLDTGAATGTAGRLQSSRRQAPTATAAAAGGPPGHLDQATISSLSARQPAEGAAKAATRRTAAGAHDLDLPRPTTKAPGATGGTGLLGTGSRGSSPRRRRQASSLRQRGTTGSSSFKSSSSSSSSTLSNRSSQRVGLADGTGHSGLNHEGEKGGSSHQLVVPAYSSQGGYAYGIYESETGILYYD